MRQRHIIINFSYKQTNIHWGMLRVRNYTMTESRENGEFIGLGQEADSLKQIGHNILTLVHKKTLQSRIVHHFSIAVTKKGQKAPSIQPQFWCTWETQVLGISGKCVTIIVPDRSAYNNFLYFLVLNY